MELSKKSELESESNRLVYGADHEKVLNELYSIPFVALPIKIFRFWGLIFQRNLRPLIIIITTTLLNVSMVAYSLKTTDPIDAVMRNFFMLVLWINTEVRVVCMTLRMKKFENFLIDFINLYKDIKESEVPIWIENLETSDLLGAKLAKSNVVAGLMTVMTALGTTLLASQRVLVYGNYIPGVDVLQSPYYEVLYLYHTILSPVGCLTYIPFSSLIVSLIMFAIVMTKNLNQSLQSIKEEKSMAVVGKKLIWCVKYQKTILSFIGILNDLVTYAFLAEFLLFGALICVLLLLLNIADNFGHLLIALIQIFMVFMQLCTLYWFANELSDATISVSEAAYDTDWFRLPNDFQKTILLLILRAQKPTTLTVGNVYPMSMEMFQSLVNASYSYYTLLRRFSD